MLIDARTLPDAHTIDADLCVVGGGVAGLTIAREFVGHDIDVCVLEQGGLEDEADAQRVNRGEVKGYPYWGLDYARHAQVGGASHRWGLTLADGRKGARFRPLDPIDFEQREEIPFSGWPFSKAELAPYYDRAQALFQIGPDRYDVARWTVPQEELLFRECPSLQTVGFQYGPRTAFTDEYRETVERADNVTVFYHARALAVETNEAGRAVSHIRAATPSGTEMTVRARAFVLAMGGIENARLLLVSTGTHAQGLGNHNDLVGRFFMEHLHFRAGVLWPREFSRYPLYTPHDQDGTTVHGKLALRSDVLRRERLRNFCFSLSPTAHPYDPLPTSEAFEAARVTWSTLRRGYLPDAPWSKLWTLLTKSGALVQHLGTKLKEKMGEAPPLQAFSLHHFTEQAPNPDSRVRLSTRKMDRYGQPRARLDWRISDADVRDVLRGVELLKPEVERTDKWRLELTDYEQLPPPGIRGGFHHMGTTRMHDDPHRGVVNTDGRVHGVANLFVAGASVFPTGGYANPTFTIGALALRLADHLRDELYPRTSRPNAVSTTIPPDRTV